MAESADDFSNPPDLAANEQVAAASDMEKDRQMRPVDDEASPDNLMKGGLTTEAANEPMNNTQLSEDEQNDSAVQAEQERLRKNNFTDDLNQTFGKTAGGIKSLVNRREIKKLEKDRQEVEERISTLTKRINKLKLKWWNAIILTVNILLIFVGIGVATTTVKLLRDAERESVIKILKKARSKKEKELEAVNTQIYNLVNLFKRQAAASNEPMGNDADQQAA